jgi:hypothetical protein
MKPEAILQLLGATARGVGGDVGRGVGGLLERLAEVVARFGVGEAQARIEYLLANPPHEAELAKMHEILERRRREESNGGTE